MVWWEPRLLQTDLILNSKLNENCDLELPRESTRLLQMTGERQYDEVMWLALLSVKYTNAYLLNQIRYSISISSYPFVLKRLGEVHSRPNPFFKIIVVPGIEPAISWLVDTHTDQSIKEAFGNWFGLIDKIPLLRRIGFFSVCFLYCGVMYEWWKCDEEEAYIETCENTWKIPYTRHYFCVRTQRFRFTSERLDLFWLLAKPIISDDSRAHVNLNL